MKIIYENDKLNVKGLLKSNDINYSDIDRVYMRIEEACANMCCGRMNFDRYFLMLMVGDELVKVELDNKDLVSEGIKKIQEKNPDVLVGKSH